MINTATKTQLHRHLYLWLSLLVFIITLSPGQLLAGSKPVIGWVEHIKVNDRELELEAKIDTGADSSSISAKIIKTWTKNHVEWVQFQVTNKKKKKLVLERKIERYIRVKRRQTTSVRRPVVKIRICLGTVSREVEVNLADRSNFKYPILIGRDYLDDTYLVDSALTFTRTPSCP